MIQVEQQMQDCPESMDASVHTQMLYNDHFNVTRHEQASRVTFRGESIYIYDHGASQVQIRISRKKQLHDYSSNRSETEEIDESNRTQNSFYLSPLQIDTKDVQHDRGARWIYTLIALFCMATFFSFGFLVLLFLFMELVADCGLSGLRTTFLTFRFLGTMCAIPVFVYGFSTMLTVWQFFISESWNGFPFLRNVVTDLDDIFIEWVTIIMMIGAPVVALVINLFRKSEQFWENTIFVWYISVSLFFVFFAVLVAYCEVETSWLIIFKNAEYDVRQSSRWSKIKYFVGHALKRTQEKHYCGYKEKVEMKKSSVIVAKGDDSSQGEDDIVLHSIKFWVRWYTRLTQHACLSPFFEPIQPPRKVVSVDDILSNRRFFTKDTWSIEKSLYSRSFAHNIPVTRGPVALRKSQIISTIVAFGLSILAKILLILGALTWFDYPLSILTILLVFVLIMACNIPKIMIVRRFMCAMRKESEGAVDNSEINIDHCDEDGIYHNVETYRVSRPTRTFRWINMFLHIGVFNLFPMVTMIVLKNYPILVLFMIMSIWACARYWFDPVNMVSYHGDLERVCRSSHKVSSQEWKDKSRISNLLVNGTRARGTKAWISAILLLFGLVFFFSISVILYETGRKEHNWHQAARLARRGDFEYLPQPNLKYPTCSLMNNANLVNSSNTALMDYNFMADIIFERETTQQGTLDRWFGPEVAKIDHHIANDYRSTLPASNLAVAYNYDVISFGDDRKVIVLRGSTTPWEWLSDLQLWAGLTLIQIFAQRLVPFGRLFNPILDEILQGINLVQSKQLKEIQLNSQATGFVNYIRNELGFEGQLSITGSSLGGGASLITGAQTKIPAISFSAPGTIYARKTFDPVLDVDTINSLLFNVIPDRDYVPLIDKQGVLTQTISCNAKTNHFLDCHNPTRTMCELMYNCGSNGRPIHCDCAVRFGYPEPVQMGNKTFSEVCGTKRTNDGNTFQYDDDSTPWDDI